MLCCTDCVSYLWAPVPVLDQFTSSGQRTGRLSHGSPNTRPKVSACTYPFETWNSNLSYLWLAAVLIHLDCILGSEGRRERDLGRPDPAEHTDTTIVYGGTPIVSWGLLICSFKSKALFVFTGVPRSGLTAVGNGGIRAENTGVSSETSSSCAQDISGDPLLL